MRENKQFGKRITASARSAVDRLEAGISEGYLLPDQSVRREGPNLFGREPLVQVSQEISALVGLASTGLRAAAFLQGNDLMGNYAALSAAARQHLPLVIYAASSDHHAYHAISGANCFQFFASSPQEAVDLGLIAHKLAERSLVPGIVMMDDRQTAFSEGEIEMPDAGFVRAFLGDPDELIGSPTPAQEMIFGRRRRRIPNWFQLDQPVLSGVRKDPAAWAREAAARQRFFHHHLPELLADILSEFEQATGRSYAGLSAYQTQDARYLILCQGALFAEVCKTVDQLRKEKKARIGCVNLNFLRPFPQQSLRKLLSGKRAVTVLEYADTQVSGPMPLMGAVLASLHEGKKMPKLFAGRYGTAPGMDALSAAFENMMPGGKEQQDYFLDIAFSRPASDFPKHEVMLQRLNRLYPGIEEEQLYRASQGAPKPSGKNLPTDYPLSVRRYRDQGPPYSRLSRFNDNTAGFYHNDHREELVADPFQALPLVPPAAAHLAPPEREQVPVFHPASCTGCGQCFVHCPHAAIPPLAISPTRLLQSAMDIATSRGEAVSQLRPIIKNLALLAGKVIREADEPINRAEDFLPVAFEGLAKKMKWAGEKEESMRGAFEKVLETISDMPVAITDTFFTQPESLEKGTGELFSLAIDPHACTGCGLCAALCEDDALEMQPQEAAHLPIMQAGFQLWEQLPDTPGSTITRLNHDPSYDPFASILLSRNFYLSMAGASPTEKGLGAKAMLHNITALTESLVQPHLLTQSQQLQQQIDQLREQIEAKWKDALSLAGLEPSQAIFDATGTDRMSMKEWVSKLDETTHLKPLEVSLLKRKLNLASALKNLNGLLEEGPTGAGRSRYGLVLLDTDLGDWSDSYPLNVFCAPVALSSDGSGVEKVIGLVRGYLRHMIDNLKLMRRADLELGKKGTYEPEVDDKVLAALQWEDLTGEEKHFIPPILLLGSKRLLTEKPFAQLQQLLASNWPVKLFIIDDGRLPADENAPAALLQSSSMILSALAMNNSFVLQSSMADPRHLFFGLKEGMEKEGPALFHLLAPETADNSWPQMAHKALETRAFPILISRPSGSQKPLLSELLELEANPKPGETWVETSLGGEDQALSYHLTLADSLYEQAEWEGHFKAFSEAMGTATSLADYLKLEEGEKAGKVPVIFRIDASGQRETWVPSNAVLAVTAVGLFRWQRLQEIGGLLSPFPLKLKAQVEQELKEKYEREAAALRAELTEARNHFEEAHLRQIKAKLKDKLLSLSQKGKG